MDIELKALTQLTQKLNLLYVEDDANTREEMLSILKPFFQNIHVATNGQEGLEKFSSNDIDLIMTDIVMPQLTGLEMIKQIRENDSELPILVFSAYSEIDHLKQAIDFNVDGFLSKPITYNQYFKVIKKVANNINNKKELLDYKKNLEYKVQEQVKEIKLKDKMLEQHAKLAAMGEMIDIIAHQWKQPLNIISMRASYIKEISLEEQTVKLENLVECSTKVSEQIVHLVDTLQEFREFFRPIEQAESIHLDELMESLSVLLHDDLIKSKIDLRFDFKEITFDGNKNEFKHFFINLINNARDAFVLNNIDNRVITVTAKELEDKVYIDVEDNAGGIPKDIISKIFEPNFTTKKSSGGTGIGLYMCKTIINKHHGKLKVSTDKDTTKFTIELKR